MSRVRKDPYRISAYIYDFFVSSPNSRFKQRLLRTAPLRPGMQVLDIGCGTGSDLELYARAGCRVHGVDTSPTMLKLARRRLGELADLRLCSAGRLPYRDDSFDLVLTSFTLHELPFEVRAAVIAEMARVVRPSGRIRLIDFRSPPYHSLRERADSVIIYIYERMAGGEHFRNGRDFLRRGGIQGLVFRSPLEVSARFLPKNRAIGVYLLQKEDIRGGSSS
jgi:ubiquinone/menaquinone biosynthesis C-methylase UbiE